MNMGAQYCRLNIAEKNLRNFIIFNFIPAFAHIAERDNIAEIA
jgi:hypothetical protein